MRIRKKIIFIFPFLLAFGSVQAQIYSPAASDSINSQFGSDKVFIFNSPRFGDEVIASIIAVSVDELANWTFQWSVYEPQDSGYRDITSTSTGKTSAIDTITVSSGYRVSMTNGTQSDTFGVWIIMNDLDVKITNKDEADTVLFGYYNCSSLDLRADTTRPPLYYYNPVTSQKISLFNIYTIRWTADNSEGSTPPSRLLTRVTSPPWMDTWYTITITDSYGIERTDSAFYKSIQSKAILNDQYIKLDTNNYPDRMWYQMFYNYDTPSAPANYEFDVSESKNMASYLLVFGDGDSVMLGKDSLTLRHEYRKPGDYKVKLITKSERPYECIASDTTVTIIVQLAESATFQIPNIFTPVKDGRYKIDENDLFRSTEVSVIFIDITIFSRTGRKVHQFEGYIRDWEGWDGRIMDGADAPEGVYFYVISRFDAYQSSLDPIKKDVLNGFIHLYRE